MPFKQILLFTLIFSAGCLKAQLDPSPVVAGLQSDINYLARGFLEPLGDASAAALSRGWHTNANIAEPGSFRVQLSNSLVLVPQAQTNLAINPSELKELSLVNPNDNVTPTAFGANRPGVALQYDNAALPLGLGDREFNMPAGYGFAILPFTALQTDVSIFKKTELSLRFLPNLQCPYLEDTRFNSWGLGLSHNLSQWIQAWREAPVQMALVLGDQQLYFEQDLPQGSGENKSLLLNSEALNSQFLVSWNQGFFALYSLLGYTFAQSNIQLKGTYRYINPLSVSNPEQEIKDPVNFTTTHASALSATLGMRFNLLEISFISAEYTFSYYSALALNLGIHIKF